MTEQALMQQIIAIGQIHLEGNIVPPSWYQHLKYPSGKPYHIAITLLGEIVYWFRPRMVRDEHTGEFVGWAKKFRGDGIQRSYAAWGSPFGFTKRESADAIKYLVSEGLISTEIRDITLPDGTLRPNVVVVTSLDPERLRAITYGRRGDPTPDRHTPSGYPVSTEEVVPRNVIPAIPYDISTQDLLPKDVAPSPDPAQGGMTPEGTCLEINNIKNIHEITLRPTLYQEEVRDNACIPTPASEFFVNQENEGITATPDLAPPASVQDTTPTAPTESAEGKGAYPAVLLKPKSRRAVLAQGQRPSRDDLAYPNVAAACSWMARAWNLALVVAVLPDEPAVHAQLAELEAVLATLREDALRARQLTFAQLLDDYLRDDQSLQAVLRAARPLARVTEFTLAARDIQTQWQDAPGEDELKLLKTMFDDEAA